MKAVINVLKATCDTLAGLSEIVDLSSSMKREKMSRSRRGFAILSGCH